MLQREELIKAIEECEALPASYQNCEKLATFFILLDHADASHEDKEAVKVTVEEVIAEQGDSEFLTAVTGKRSSAVWPILDELMTTLAVLQPRLYAGVMHRIKE